MRIAYIYQYFRTPTNGGGLRAYEFARRWALSGHEVHMIAARPGDAKGWQVEEVEGITVHTTGRVPSTVNTIAERFRSYSSFSAAALPRVRSLHPGVVYASSTPLTVSIPAMAAGVPYVFEVRDMWPDVPIAMGYLRNPLLRMSAVGLEGQAYKRAAHVVTLAPGMRDDIIAKGVPGHKVTTITQGCDTYLFDECDPIQMRAANPWLKDRPIIAYVGSLGPSHGVKYVPELAKAALDAGKDWAFVVVGRGTQQDEIRSLATALGVIDVNFYMLGALPKVEAAGWFKSAAISLALGYGPKALLKDGANNKFFDAIAAGVPTATNFSSFQTTLSQEHGVGFEIPNTNAAMAVEIMGDRLDDVNWLDAVEANCRELALGAFNRDRLADHALSLLTSIE